MNVLSFGVFVVVILMEVRADEREHTGSSAGFPAQPPGPMPQSFPQSGGGMSGMPSGSPMPSGMGGMPSGGPMPNGMSGMPAGGPMPGIGMFAGQGGRGANGLQGLDVMLAKRMIGFMNQYIRNRMQDRDSGANGRPGGMRSGPAFHHMAGNGPQMGPMHGMGHNNYGGMHGPNAGGHGHGMPPHPSQQDGQMHPGAYPEPPHGPVPPHMSPHGGGPGGGGYPGQRGGPDSREETTAIPSAGAGDTFPSPVPMTTGIPSAGTPDLSTAPVGGQSGGPVSDGADKNSTKTGMSDKFRRTGK